MSITKPKDTVMTLRVPQDLKERYERIAQIDSRSASHFARQALEEKIEEFERLMTAKEELEGFFAGSVEAKSLDHVMKELDLD